MARKSYMLKAFWRVAGCVILDYTVYKNTLLDVTKWFWSIKILASGVREQSMHR